MQVIVLFAMSLIKLKFLKSRKEATVTFVDDNNVQCVNSYKCGEANEGKRKLKLINDLPTPSPARKSNKVTDKEIVEDISNDGPSSDEGSRIDKPQALFQDGDVPGKAVFGFHTPKRRNAMAEKAAESAEKGTPLSACESPKTPTSSHKKPFGFKPRARRSIALNLISENDQQSPRQLTNSNGSKISRSSKKDPSFETGNPKTPYSLRARLKSKIAAQVERTLKEFDSEDSGEDYVPSDFDEDDDENSDASTNEDFVNLATTNNLTSYNATKSDSVKISSNTPLQKRKQKDLIYAITVDEYFNSNNGKKNKTSNHTLSKLKNPRLEQDQLNKLLGNINSKSIHRSVLDDLHKENCSENLFEKWCFCLKEGFSILLYGLGSKHKILNMFHHNVLSNNHVLVVNGFFPGLSIKEIIDSLAGELLNIKDIPSQIHEVIELIEAKLSSRRAPPIFLIVHNLDGVMLRCEKAQGFLARLASIPKCYLLASVDHINAPLLWDDKKLSEYNFIWEDVTSFNIYVEETSFENSLLVQRSGTLALASLKNVFQSLTKNGKEIFKILLNDCLENKKNHKYAGIGFSDLYWRCRDNFLVSTDLALRSQLTEFLDHQLVKWRKDSDHLIVPVDTAVLEQFKNLVDTDE